MAGVDSQSVYVILRQLWMGFQSRCPMTRSVAWPGEERLLVTGLPDPLIDPPEADPADPAQARAVRTVALVGLGCAKNLVDSEKMLGLLAQGGLVLTNDEAQADAIVINTCGFLEASKQEAIQEIQQAAALKRTGQCKRLVVAGCLVQRDRAKLLDRCPQIDALVGVFDRDRIVDAVLGPKPNGGVPHDVAASLPVYASIAPNAAVAKHRRKINQRGYHEDDSARLRLTPRHYAYLRVSEGCNQNCAFCTIPSIRGKMRSKPVDRILAEARELIADGAFELNLIGQDTTSYGQDIGYEPGLAGLLERLDDTVSQATSGAGAWIRLMYAYPSCFTDAMIDAIATLPNVVKYIDLPLQHINDRVLDRMRRRTSRRQIETLLNKLRDRIPGVAIRTTFITGFPGETDAQHQELVRFVRGFGFDAMGVFTYSPEPGTPAGTLHASGQAIDEQVAQHRHEELMLAQQGVVFARNQRLAQEQARLEVLIDQATQRDQAGIQDGDHLTLEEDTAAVSGQLGAYLGRAYSQAPQIDGVMGIDTDQRLVPGELVRCRVTQAHGYDLVAQPVVGCGSRALPVLG